MTNTNSRTTRLTKFIAALYHRAHGHQINGLVSFVGALLEIKSCTQAKLVSAFENKKAALKRLSRLLYNERLQTDHLKLITPSRMAHCHPSPRADDNQRVPGKS
jgi:hypothetical protein